MSAHFLGAAFEFSDLLRCELVVPVAEFLTDLFRNLVLLRRRQPTDLFQNFRRTHETNSNHR